MAARPLLVMLIVRDAGLRSALAARLSEGFDLLTAARWESVAGRRVVRPPSVLVIDAESIVDLDIDLLVERHGLARIVALSANAPPTVDGRLIHISSRGAIDSLSQLFTGLIDSDQSAPSREA